MSAMYFTSESVTEGHPDKLCDQISDAILDEYLRHDPNSRVACETLLSRNLIVIAGEITSKHVADIPGIARRVIRDVGYNKEFGFDPDTSSVVMSIGRQSSDIAVGVNASQERKSGSEKQEDAYGAGDQGIVFGYACDETKEYMPLPIQLSHKLVKQLTDVRKSGSVDYLGPDGKSEVTVEYDRGVPVRIHGIVISSQHRDCIEQRQLYRDIMEKVIAPVVPSSMVDAETKYFINPTGRFVIGGPEGDAGLTGRKVIVDTYGGYGGHGGGAFSGKDPTKVDRAAAYFARYAAKNIVAANLSRKCEIQVAYIIGVAHPISVRVNTFGTGKYGDEILTEATQAVFDFRPSSIIDSLDLRRPIYERLAVLGHMGREDLDVAWEKTDKVPCLQRWLDRP